MPLPDEINDGDVPDATAVVGDVEAFIAYVEDGRAWKDWEGKCTQTFQLFAELFGDVSADVQRELLTKPMDIHPPHKPPYIP